MLQRTKEVIKVIRMVSIYGATQGSVKRPAKMSKRLHKKLWTLYGMPVGGRKVRNPYSAYALMVRIDARTIRRLRDITPE